MSKKTAELTWLTGCTKCDEGMSNRINELVRTEKGKTDKPISRAAAYRLVVKEGNKQIGADFFTFEGIKSAYERFNRLGAYAPKKKAKSPKKQADENLNLPAMIKKSIIEGGNSQTAAIQCVASDAEFPVSDVRKAWEEWRWEKSYRLHNTILTSYQEWKSQLTDNPAADIREDEFLNWYVEKSFLQKAKIRESLDQAIDSAAREHALSLSIMKKVIHSETDLAQAIDQAIADRAALPGALAAGANVDNDSTEEAEALQIEKDMANADKEERAADESSAHKSTSESATDDAGAELNQNEGQGIDKAENGLNEATMRQVIFSYQLHIKAFVQSFMEAEKITQAAAIKKVAALLNEIAPTTGKPVFRANSIRYLLDADGVKLNTQEVTT